MGSPQDPQPRKQEQKPAAKIDTSPDSLEETRTLPDAQAPQTADQAGVSAPAVQNSYMISSEPLPADADDTTVLLPSASAAERTQILPEPSDSVRPQTGEAEDISSGEHLIPPAQAAGPGPLTEKHLIEPSSLSTMRYTLAIVAAVISLLCALGGSLSVWVSQNLVSQSGFDQLSTQLLDDRDLQQRLADAAVTDVMNSDQLKRVFPENPGNNLFSQILSVGRGEVQKRLSESARALTESTEYRGVWRQVAADTHTYNLAHPDDPAALDISAFYRELDAQIGVIGIYDPDISAWGHHIMPFDREGNPVQQAIQRTRWLGDLSGTLLPVSVLSLAVSLVLLPRGRFLLLAGFFLTLAVSLWILSAVMAQQTPQSLGISTESAVGTAYLDGLIGTARPALTGYLNALASYSIGAAVIALLSGILVKLIALTASDTTVRTH